MGYCIWAFWLPMSLLLLFVNVIAQPGFLSIDCGGKGNHTAENNITWSSDADYIDVGEIADIGNASEEAEGSYLHTLRFFPKPLKKSCYHLPVTPTVPYLLRTWFAIGNYTGFKQSPSFQLSIETLGMLFSDNITTSYDYYPWYDEVIFVSSGDVVYVCLITAIELRALREGMYRQAKPGTLLL